jgi:hypothetical protein
MNGARRADRVPGAAGSGAHAIGVGQLRAVMRRYISPILVDSVLERALQASSRNPAGVTDLNAFTEDCMIGLRLFVRAEQLPALMLELAEILEEHDGR